MLGTGTVGAHGSAGIRAQWKFSGDKHKSLQVYIERILDGPRKMGLSRLKVAYHRDFFILLS